MEKKRTLLILLTLSIFFSLGCSINAASVPQESKNDAADKPPSSTGKPTTSPSPPLTTNATTPTPTPTSTTPTTTTPSPTPSSTSTAAPTTHSPITTSSPVTSTVTPTSSPSPAPSPKPDRSFDLPSFVGGIILALGVLAIGYVVYKFYRARTDPNYRTL